MALLLPKASRKARRDRRRELNLRYSYQISSILPELSFLPEVRYRDARAISLRRVSSRCRYRVQGSQEEAAQHHAPVRPQAGQAWVLRRVSVREEVPQPAEAEAAARQVQAPV